MAKIIFQNFQERGVSLAIEPWAMAETVPPDGTVEIEVADHPPPEIGFAISEDGSPLIAVVSSMVRFRAQGEVWELHCKDEP